MTERSTCSRGSTSPGHRSKSQLPGGEPPAGRNIGVRLARNDLIACTDAGCRPEPSWLEALERDLGRADLVIGRFDARGETPFERIAALTYFPIPQELDQRSVLLRLAHRLFGRGYESSDPAGASIAFVAARGRQQGDFPKPNLLARSLPSFGQSLSADTPQCFRPMPL